MSDATTVRLARGAVMPRLGLGTWPMDDAQAARSVVAAVEAGYRLFDTAENYGNERGVGQGVRDCGLPREQLFVTTKFNAQWHGRDLVREAFDGSARRLGLDYVDLLLIHWPNPEQDRYVDAWRGMLDLLAEGRLRAVGVSNFKPAHLRRLLDETGELPDVNQIQLSPYTTRAQAREFHVEHAVVTQTWSPLGRGTELLEEPVIVDAAKAHGRTPAQVVLRWHLQLGLSTVPKSAHPQRMRENLAVFDFALTDAEMALISGLDRGEQAAADSDAFGH
ncbi:aldo/keto reductase [Catellatospora tritici]|uniref:aldo/keto reductase n=1 Tax=Catellatospora tritici TaxID=2851566 RepID=UPI001C2CD959|nr:aldo/keto reductase [Catellatospora tritici]MBV1850738.1 aldo/keto reductase [Catellatospora tritici]MBV1850991.1 aldo/keto reductase [Catellatospora tritici]